MGKTGRIRALLAALWMLPACALDREEDVRAYLDQWLWPGTQTYFATARSCTVAVYRLDTDGLRSGVPRVYDLRQGLRMLRRGRAVAFSVPGLSPDAVSQAVISADLHTGLGMLSSATGPRACMTDPVARGVYAMLTGRGVLTIYDPVENVLVLVDPATRHGVFMRGAV